MNPQDDQDLIDQDDIKIGDVFSIHVGDSRRWNGYYEVIGFESADVILRNTDTGEEDFMRAEFLTTWDRVAE